MCMRTILPGLMLALLALAELPDPAAPQSALPDQKGVKLKDLLNERLAALKSLAKLAQQEYLAGRASFDRVHQANRAMSNAELELSESDKERTAVLEKTLVLAKDNEHSTLARYKTGNASHSDTLLATVGRLEAEIALEKVKVPARPK
jgi:outer membrane protein TolC